MSSPTISTKKRLIAMLLLVSIASLSLTIRLGYLQIVKGEELKKLALEQWTRDIPVKAKRGVIFDRKGKKLAISVSADTVWCRPADIKNPKETAEILAEVLNLDEDNVYKKITSRQSVVKIKMWISKDEADILRSKKLSGIEIVDDNKRYYPYGNFAAYILGFTDIDNVGLYGIEKTYNKYLTGTPGRWIKTADAVGRQLPYANEKLYEPKDGLSVVLTIDETIQHFAEKAALEALVKNKAKRVSIIIMEPKTGDILAMASKPDYDPNNPREPLDEDTKKQWEGLSQKELIKKWYDMWRNFPINDVYEPGSTFKIITAAAGLEENVVTPESQFYCDGFITSVKGARLKCWRWYNPHGSETFVEGVQNSCNEVFVAVGQRLGKERMYKYIKAFGFGEKTGIELTGEQSGIIPRGPEYMKEVNLATISYGQGIAVTPIQLITAISAVANGGNLMKPRIVKELVDSKGNVVHEFKPVVKRKVISKDTSKTLLSILETVVSSGTGKKAYVPGYRIGGKTGTAQKVINGRYAEGKYIASFVAIAPVNDPKITVLVVIDEPSNGEYYGGRIAAPVAGQVVKDILNYLDVEPQFTEDEQKDNNKKIVTVPEVRNLTIKEAANKLKKFGLDYNTETLDIQKNALVIDQFPLPGTKVKKGSMIDLYVYSRRKEDSKIVVPNLKGKTMEEVTELLNNLNLRFKFKGNGVAKSQYPAAGTMVEFNSLVEVEFDKVN
ncbi:stage V sporulation protein D [Caloranaerobacter ferrireducens]|uniref:stage V sporulation protein D n=1 Tax=Caloranaerobacter ferrireducens TaxID=1323370 RepID=UPI00084D2077|nr:stage V sporulation protein D [Caloranaerobacter ferrireducens]